MQLACRLFNREARRKKAARGTDRLSGDTRKRNCARAPCGTAGDTNTMRAREKRAGGMRKRADERPLPDPEG